jgi:hypothetical protein
MTLENVGFKHSAHYTPQLKQASGQGELPGTGTELETLVNPTPVTPQKKGNWVLPALATTATAALAIWQRKNIAGLADQGFKFVKTNAPKLGENIKQFATLAGEKTTSGFKQAKTKTKEFANTHGETIGATLEGVGEVMEESFLWDVAIDHGDDLFHSIF